MVAGFIQENELGKLLARERRGGYLEVKVSKLAVITS